MFASTRPHTTPELQASIQNCLDCHAICTETLDYCVQMGGMHASPDHLRLLMDCAEICRTSAGFMLRHSPFHEMTCSVCSSVCLRCAEACGHMADDSQMQLCADACRRCAESCERMSAEVQQ